MAWGAFIINEFSQVICPVSRSSDRYLVGEAHGRLYFEDKKNGSGFISLCDVDELDCGDDWDRPYMGIKYQLHAEDHIYFWNEDEEGGSKQYPKHQDEELIKKLREVRPNGAMSFLVNQHGIVVTKKELSRNLWKPVYVGRINYKLWFEKECNHKQRIVLEENWPVSISKDAKKNNYELWFKKEGSHMQLTVFKGNWPVSVSKDAKYSVRSEGRKYVVGIVYETKDGEKWYPTSDEHETLVKMVNTIKRELNSSSGGAFYINEYRQVIVPAGDPVTYFYAGDYEKDLIFDFEGKKLCGLPVDLKGNQLNLGDIWEGPHAGIPYTLKAGAKDIFYTKKIRPKVTKDELLSEHVGPVKARKTASKIAAIKGAAGGRFYVNECRSIFAPLERGGIWEYIYIGKLEDDDPWFPRPHRTDW